jgi:NADH-quinone oxidoreductase subunit F
LDLLLEIGDTIGIIPGTTICGLSDGAAWPLKNGIRKFREELETYIRTTNPADFDCEEPAFALELATAH